jgi:protein-S-isoprenylcysteine O-methyltransferase Ste14
MSKTKKINPISLILQLVAVLIVMPFLPLLVTFRWNWWEAWVYGVIGCLGFIVSRGLAVKKHPDILEERSRSFSNKGVKPWDKFLSPAMGIGSVLIPLIAGLDARFGWSGNFNLPLKFGSLAILLSGYLLSTYAIVTNKFFSGTVRIQTDRGHTVCQEGPYSWVRHPGYTGALLAFLGTPVFLDSLWGFIPVVLLFVITFIRTSLEDRTLQQELDGYKEYAERIRSKLIPFVW